MGPCVSAPKQNEPVAPLDLSLLDPRSLESWKQFFESLQGKFVEINTCCQGTVDRATWKGVVLKDLGAFNEQHISTAEHWHYIDYCNIREVWLLENCEVLKLVKATRVKDNQIIQYEDCTPPAIWKYFDKWGKVVNNDRKKKIFHFKNGETKSYDNGRNALVFVYKKCTAIRHLFPEEWSAVNGSVPHENYRKLLERERDIIWRRRLGMD